MNQQCTVGLVTVTYNSAGVIDGFMSSLLRQTYTDFRVYLVDNASSDSTVAQVEQCGDMRVRVIRNDDNVGFAQANNQGTRAALESGCDFVLFINNDTEFAPELLENLVAALRQSSCHMVAPKIVFYDKPQMIWSAGGGFSPVKGYAGFHYGVRQIDVGQYDQQRTVDHAPACCLLIRREVFQRIGLLDERYFAYHDDTDFCYRAKRAGLTILYYPSAKLLHKASSLTGGEDSVFSVRFRTRNQIYFMLKNLGVWRALPYLPAFHVYLLMKVVTGRISASSFRLREKAFWEGLRVWMHSILE
jgi:GT2 family glycosyltransferase